MELKRRRQQGATEGLETVKKKAGGKAFSKEKIIVAEQIFHIS